MDENKTDESNLVEAVVQAILPCSHNERVVEVEDNGNGLLLDPVLASRHRTQAKAVRPEHWLQVDLDRPICRTTQQC